jgi:hypothetical protein
MRYWMDMSRQFFTKDMVIRIVGDDGETIFPLIQKSDLEGRFDYRASVLPSIAGQQDIKKKQDMDLFQLLINLPFVDPQKLTQKVLADWNWTLDSVVKGEDEAQPQLGPDGQPMLGPDGQPLPPAEDPIAAMMGGSPEVAPPSTGTKNIPPDVARGALAMLRKGTGAPAPSPFAQASTPINLLTGGMPPTAPRIPLPTSNSRGMNRTGKVNTNTSPSSINSNPESQLMNRASSLQRKK